MPIVDIEKSKQIEFGYGDIEVAAGLLQAKDTIGTVLFWNNGKQNEIGAYHEYEENKVMSIEETPVRMVFNKIESIDVVIDALEKAKKMMIDQQNV
jgi:NAD(P)H-hydrate repair Nnr-like enzyme with NAD(P)H-hydrate epimerase domain